MKRGDWERQAGNWIAWARDLADDAYHQYSSGFFDEVVLPPGRATLDLGCGEGRSTRDLVSRGHRAVAIDGSPTMIAAAGGLDDAGRYLVADAAALPFPEGAFDQVVAYNVLMDLDDLPAALLEVRRVLSAGGHVSACVLHPIAEAGRFEDDGDGRSPGSPFVIRGSYLEARSYRERFSRDGFTMTFSSSTYPLETYSRYLERAGFVIEMLREPVPPEAAVKDDPGEERWTRVPLFLFFRAVARPDPAAAMSS